MDASDLTRTTLTRWLWILAVLSASVVVVLSILLWSQADPAAIQVEVFKFAAQVFVVAVLGTTGSWILAEHNRGRAAADRLLQEEKDRLSALRSLRRDVLTKVTESYTGTKRLRRVVRARFSKGSDITQAQPMSVAPAVYDETLREINDYQLELEMVRKDLATYELPERDLLRDHLSRMEKYLRRLVREYETLDVDPARLDHIAISSIPELGEFIGRHDVTTTFNREFSEPFAQFARELRGRLLQETAITATGSNA
jgi:hypothetical protein